MHLLVERLAVIKSTLTVMHSVSECIPAFSFVQGSCFPWELQLQAGRVSIQGPRHKL